jgi:hypothetical protein
LKQETDRRKVPPHIWLMREFHASSFSAREFSEIRGFHSKHRSACLFPGSRKSSHRMAKTILFGVKRYDDNHVWRNNGMLLVVRSAGLQAAKTGTVPASSVLVP